MYDEEKIDNLKSLIIIMGCNGKLPKSRHEEFHENRLNKFRNT